MVVDANGLVLQQLISSFVFAKLDWPMFISFKELVHNEKQILGVQKVLSDFKWRTQEQCAETCVKRGKYWEEQILPIYWLWRQKSLFLTGTNWKGVCSIFMEIFAMKYTILNTYLSCRFCRDINWKGKIYWLFLTGSRWNGVCSRYSILPRIFYFTEICKKSKSTVFIHYEMVFFHVISFIQ